jgi:hypothetical protein
MLSGRAHPAEIERERSIEQASPVEHWFALTPDQRDPAEFARLGPLVQPRANRSGFHRSIVMGSDCRLGP